MSDGTTRPAHSARRWWERRGDARAPETLEDMRLYVEGGLVPVGCTGCRTEVLVKKNSSKHTSVQWTSDAVLTCPEIGAQVAAGARGAQILGCSALKRSIDEAVRAGVVAVPGD